MNRVLSVTFSFALLLTSTHAAEKKKVASVRSWSGQVGTVPSRCGECLLNEADLKRFWYYWAIPAPMPKIDFKEEFAIFFMGHGGPHLMEMTLDGDGNLETKYVQTPTWSPRLNYLITTVKRRGIRSVNGQPLDPKSTS
ncbi:MAG TPA: hypothetical protein VFL80_10690 [Thermoanaerobaculia bacterium]|nr:hypothetical protein [Thermoanaerobaculia bacterium]